MADTATINNKLVMGDVLEAKEIALFSPHLNEDFEQDKQLWEEREAKKPLEYRAKQRWEDSLAYCQIVRAYYRQRCRQRCRPELFELVIAEVYEAGRRRRIAAAKRKFAEVLSTKYATAESIVKPAVRAVARSGVFQWCKGAAASAFSFIGRQVAKISWRDVGSRVMSILTSQLGREIAKKLFGEVGGNLLRRLQQFIGGTSDRLFNRLFGGLTN